LHQPSTERAKKQQQQPTIAATSASMITAATAPATQQPATSHGIAAHQQKSTATAPVISSPSKMDYQLFCILSQIGFPEHKSLSVSSVYHTYEDLEDIFCVYAGNRIAVHICLYNDFVLILDADELQLLLNVYDWFMDNISNPKFDWTIHPASKIPPTITGTINTTTTTTNTVIAKFDIPTEYHTSTLEMLLTTCHTITKMHYIIANHQIVALQ
jgi:hypothetical protein